MQLEAAGGFSAGNPVCDVSRALGKREGWEWKEGAVSKLSGRDGNGQGRVGRRTNGVLVFEDLKSWVSHIN